MTSTTESNSDLLATQQGKPAKWLTRRRVLAAMAATAVGLYTDMCYIEPRWLGIGRYQVPILGLGASPIRILHLSDLHVSRETPLSFVEHAIAMGLNEKPDMVCLTGDFITVTWDDWQAYSNVLSELNHVGPCYATTGNHDGGGWMSYHGGYENPQRVVTMLEAANIRVLMNESADVALPGKETFQLMGFGDMWAKDFHPYEILNENVHDKPRVLMSHNPDTKDLIGNMDWDLMLSGHTHGGQLTLPWGSTPFAPVQDHRFVRGLHRWQNHWLYVTKGVGSLRKMRLNCFPEISIVDLVPKTA